jgi:hypothetical protein
MNNKLEKNEEGDCGGQVQGNIPAFAGMKGKLCFWRFKDMHHHSRL